MKIRALFFGVLFLITWSLNSQIPYNTVNVTFPVKKGVVTFTDGSSCFFNNLQYYNDTVSFLDSEMNNLYYNLDEIAKITGKSRSTAAGMFIGAGSGLILGVGFYSAIIGLAEALTFGLLEEDDASKKEKTNFLISTTLIGAGIGALTGSFIYHNKTIYASQIESIGFQSVIVPSGSKMPMIGLSMQINLR
jgi:hypothetical protein